MGWDGKDIRVFREFKVDFFFLMGVLWVGGKIRRKGEGRGGVVLVYLKDLEGSI